MLSYEEARRKVIEQVGKMRGPCATTSVSVWDARSWRWPRRLALDDCSARSGHAWRSSQRGMRSFSSISSRVHSKFATATASRLLHRFESLAGNPWFWGTPRTVWKTWEKESNVG